MMEIFWKQHPKYYSIFDFTKKSINNRQMWINEKFAFTWKIFVKSIWGIIIHHNLDFTENLRRTTAIFISSVYCVFSPTLFWQKFREINGFTKEVAQRINFSFTKYFLRRENFSFFHTMISIIKANKIIKLFQMLDDFTNFLQDF